jgi:hypothetical protein
MIRETMMMVVGLAVLERGDGDDAGLHGDERLFYAWILESKFP